MPLKPRELTTETRAKGSKISPARQIVHCVVVAHKYLLDENKHVLGVISLPCRSACVLESGFLWMLIMLLPCGLPTLGQASRGLLDAPRQLGCPTIADSHKIAVAVQHLLASGSALVLILP